MTDQSIEQLGRIAADTAMRAAADYVRLHGIRVEDYDQATQVLRAEIKASLDDALGEAKQALDAGMGRVAEATFRSNMAAAGIRAAKQFGRAA